jgi:nucleotide-binding universal stress UspA family protein
MANRRQRIHPSQNHGASNRQRTAHRADVLVFVEAAQKDVGGIGHAQRVAHAFGGDVILLHVMELAPTEGGPVDPVDWDIRKQTTRKWLDGLASTLNDTRQGAQVMLLEGPCIAQISAYLERRQNDIAAILRPNGEDNWRQRDTACGVMGSRSAAILMIPQERPAPDTKGYRRILVPLDGSARSEDALPSAATLAKAENAELVLCYIAPEPGLTAFGMLDQEAAQLSSQVTKRNTQAGQTHLARIKNRLAHYDLDISTRIVGEGDVRRALIDTITRESVDFIVMATHGQSGHRDVPVGSVASFMLERAHVPVLMVRHRMGHPENHAFSDVTAEGIRQPAGTDE